MPPTLYGAADSSAPAARTRDPGAAVMYPWSLQAPPQLSWSGHVDERHGSMPQSAALLPQHPYGLSREELACFGGVTESRVPLMPWAPAPESFLAPTTSVPASCAQLTSEREVQVGFSGGYTPQAPQTAPPPQPELSNEAKRPDDHPRSASDLDFWDTVAMLELDRPSPSIEKISYDFPKGSYDCSPFTAAHI